MTTSIPSSTSGPISIRPAGANDRLTVAQRDELSLSPGGSHLYGSSPGGSKIVYTRDQLLALSSSPNARLTPSGGGIPAEIRRSFDGQRDHSNTTSAAAVSQSTTGAASVGQDEVRSSSKTQSSQQQTGKGEQDGQRATMGSRDDQFQLDL